MFKKHQRLVAVLTIICVSMLVPIQESDAALTVTIIVTPPGTAEVRAGSDPIGLAAPAGAGGPNLTYKWKLDGPGKLEGDLEGSSVFYRPPDKINGKTVEAKIHVTVSDNEGQEATESVIFTITKSGPNWPVIGVGAAVVLGGGIYLLVKSDDDNDKPSIEITFPTEGSQVDWITDVYGTAKGFKSDYYVTVSIQPYNKDWFPQSSKGTIDVSGNWVVPTCYFGLDIPSEIGYNFRFRAELRDGDGDNNVKATDIVHKVTRK